MTRTTQITILDGQDVPHPEDTAMLQALYSRSPAHVADHLGKVKSVGSGHFMDKFYIQYGHQSIGDCGSTTIFIEGVSMLVAKAIQDWPLYSGQEASTRYMDFSESEFSDPMGRPDIQQRWRQFYLNAQAPVEAHLRQRYPIQADEDEKTYGRAIKARVFDTLRCFLPAGAATNLSWHTNLRQASDHLEGLLAHPAISVRRIAEQIWESLNARYPHSFQKRNRGNHGYLVSVEHAHFLNPQQWPNGVVLTTSLTTEKLSSYLSLLQQRPPRTPVPRTLASYGMIESKFLLDFGSYRDLQRHRNGVVRMPLLTTRFGFNPWYLEELPDLLLAEAGELISKQTERINQLDCDEFTKQDYIAMGYQVPCHVIQNLPAFIYRIELRSSKTVHPSLRHVVLSEIAEFEKIFPEIPLYVDKDPDSWAVRRGNQTIIER